MLTLNLAAINKSAREFTRENLKKLKEALVNKCESPGWEIKVLVDENVLGDLHI